MKGQSHTFEPSTTLFVPFACFLHLFCFQTCFLVASERSFFASPIIYSSVQNKEESPAHFEKRGCLFLALQKETMVLKTF